MAVLNPNDPNVAILEVVADRLGSALREQLVFVGGAVAGLLVTDAGLPAIRPTGDVDLIAQVLARSEYVVLEKLLRAQGFENDLRPGAPICRWVVDAVTVDVMPTLEDVLGFSNRWYPLAVDTAEEVELPSGLRIRVVTAPAFIATKLEAFAGRGGGDYLFSHDLGDVISIIDGRATCATIWRRPCGSCWQGAPLSTRFRVICPAIWPVRNVCLTLKAHWRRSPDLYLPEFVAWWRSRPKQRPKQRIREGLSGRALCCSAQRTVSGQA